MFVSLSNSHVEILTPNGVVSEMGHLEVIDHEGELSYVGSVSQRAPCCNNHMRMQEKASLVDCEWALTMHRIAHALILISQFQNHEKYHIPSDIEA
jgi:hypothetical protein